MRAFYDANKDMVQGGTYEQTEPQLRSMVERQEQQAAVNLLIDGLGERHEVMVTRTSSLVAESVRQPVDQARRSKATCGFWCAGLLCLRHDGADHRADRNWATG